MKKAASLIVMLLLLSGYGGGQSVKKRIRSITDGDKEYSDDWIYSFKFFGMKPKLYKDTISDEEYRFLCMPSVHHQFIISIQKKANSYSISWSKSNAVWETDSKKAKAGPLKSKEISESQWLEFVKKVHDMDFWHMVQANERLYKADGNKADSDDAWLFEGKNNKRYHIICWWEPAPHSEKLYNCLKYMLNLTGMKADMY
jgi:hypothetical protein